MRIKLYKNHIVFLLIVMATSPALSQRKIKLEPGAGKLEMFKKDGVSYTSVTGSVKFTHKGTIFYCDSAIIAKKTNYLEAYGHVKIIDGDSIVIVSRKLFYDGNTRIAKLRQDVVLTQLGRMEIFTDYLDYDRNTAIADYFNGGKIVDSTNVLTSEKGYYYTHTNIASFKTDVIGKNDDYLMESDTLVYNTKTGVVFFVATTKLTDNEGDVFHHEGGQYNSRQKRSDYVLGKVETADYFLKGNNLKLDDIRGIYHVSGDVLMVGKHDNIFITGQKSDYYKNTSTTKVYNDALMRMVIDIDTLYLTADTLISIDSEENGDKRLLAYNNVKVFKSNLQAIADSLAYGVADSVMYFYGKPVLWTDGNQLTADSINMVISNKAIDVLNMKNKAFVITQDSSKNYNQIKGREMVAQFKENELRLVSVFGNGESIFFMYDEVTNELIGMNKIVSSDITLHFENKVLTDAAFLVSPEGDFIPPHELKKTDRKLSGFVWHAELRPVLEDYIRPPIQFKNQIPSLDNKPIDLEIKKKSPPKKKQANKKSG